MNLVNKQSEMKARYKGGLVVLRKKSGVRKVVSIKQNAKMKDFVWVSFYRCGFCGSVRQYGATIEKLPCSNKFPLLLCADGCADSHLPHALIKTVCVVADGCLRNAVLERAASLRFKRLAKAV